MSVGQDPRKLFLLGQQIFRLSNIEDEEEHKLHVCGGAAAEGARTAKQRNAEQSEPWELMPRFPNKSQVASIRELLLGPKLFKRVALVCDAGLGKTTNMEWLQSCFAETGCRQVPLLLRLNDDDLKLLEKEHTHPNALLDRLAALVTKAAPGDQARHHSALERKRHSGQITLLIDVSIT